MTKASFSPIKRRNMDVKSLCIKTPENKKIYNLINQLRTQ